MSERFANLHKVPQQPAARLLAVANIKLKTKLASPANASVATVLSELEAAEAHVDIARVLSAALPPREAVWWACLAARDVAAVEGGEKPLCLQVAEAWVFDPTPENRARVFTAIDAGDPDDPAALAATAAMYAPGNLGDTDDLKDVPAPVGVVANCAFGMNVKTLDLEKDPILRLDFLIDRAIDIARGGHGQIPRPDPKPADETDQVGSETVKEEGNA